MVGEILCKAGARGLSFFFFETGGLQHCRMMIWKKFVVRRK